MNPGNIDELARWRLIFGKESIPSEEADDLLLGEEVKIDRVLEKLYGQLPHTKLNNSTPQINQWLGDIREYFPHSVVELLQKDALENLGLSKMLMKSEILENLEPNVHLIATILSLQEAMPQETKKSARFLIDKLVRELEDILSFPMIKSVHGALSSPVPQSRPRMADIDWRKTIYRNLKHYQSDYKTIIPQQIYASRRKAKSVPEIVLCVDQSASMASSVVYASIYACVLAEIRSIKTSLILFDSVPYDFSDQLGDPVDLLFGLNLGGGTDINRAVGVSRRKIWNQSETIFFLISDLEEGGNSRMLVQQLKEMHDEGIKVMILLTLSDDGKPKYNVSLASELADYNITSMACTPDKFPELVGEQLRGNNT